MSVLITSDEITKIPKLYGTENLSTNQKVLLFKFIAPEDTGLDWVWYATEYDPIEGVFFGYVEGYAGEWGYFTVAEFLENNIQRDLSFQPIKFKDYKDAKEDN